MTRRGRYAPGSDLEQPGPVRGGACDGRHAREERGAVVGEDLQAREAEVARAGGADQAARPDAVPGGPDRRRAPAHRLERSSRRRVERRAGDGDAASGAVSVHGVAAEAGESDRAVDVDARGARGNVRVVADVRVERARRARDVECDRLGAAAGTHDLLGGRLRLVETAPGDHDHGPGRGQPLGDAEADSGGATGHHRHAILDVEIRHVSPFQPLPITRSGRNSTSSGT